MANAGYYAKPGGAGYGFYDGNGNAISAYTYANDTGTDFSSLIHTLANAGDKGAAQLITQQGANLGAQETQQGVGKSFYWAGTGGADPLAQSIINQKSTGTTTPAQGTNYQQEAQYWADQQAQIDDQLNRLGTQRSVGEGNIDSSYDSAFAGLTGQQSQANRDLTTSRTNTIADNITAKNGIDDSVRANATGLQRLLQSRGAGGSSAATVLAPYAAAVTGNAQRNQVQGAYARNLSSLDTSQGDTDTKFAGAFGDLLSQKKNKVSALESSLASTEAGLQQQKATAAASAIQARGGNYASARAAESPYLARANQLLGQVDSLGAQSTFSPQTVAYTPPALSSYTYDPTAQAQVGSGVTPSQASQTGPYYTLLAGQKKDDKSLVGA